MRTLELAMQMLTKKQIRSKILFELKNQKEESREQKSKRIKNKLFRVLAFRKAKTVMFYVAMDGEVNTEEMIKEAINLGKKVSVPVCTKDRVTIRPCILNRKTELKKGLYGVGEPAVKRYLQLKDLDLVVVPGIAFDKKGNRLGRGKGCYDRLLSKLPSHIPTVGLAFDFQVISSVTSTIRDVKVNKVLFA